MSVFDDLQETVRTIPAETLRQLETADAQEIPAALLDGDGPAADSGWLRESFRDLDALLQFASEPDHALAELPPLDIQHGREEAVSGPTPVMAFAGLEALAQTPALADHDWPELPTSSPASDQFADLEALANTSALADNDWPALPDFSPLTEQTGDGLLPVPQEQERQANSPWPSGALDQEESWDDSRDVAVLPPASPQSLDPESDLAFQADAADEPTLHEAEGASADSGARIVELLERLSDDVAELVRQGEDQSEAPGDRPPGQHGPGQAPAGWYDLLATPRHSPASQSFNEEQLPRPGQGD